MLSESRHFVGITVGTMSDLPTIQQIIRQADWIGDTPMDDEEAREWFERTRKENRERHQRESDQGS